MKEALRRHYLDALGVVQYVPRDSHPVEAQSSDSQELYLSPDLSPQPQTVAVKAKRDTRNLREKELRKSESARRLPPANVEKAVSTSPTEAQSPQELQLALWQLDSDLLILNDCHNGGLSAAHYNLLRNILFAIKRDEIKIEDPEILRCPPIGAVVITDDDAGPAEYLQTFLSARLAIKKPEHVLVMGRSLAKLLLEPGVSDSNASVLAQGAGNCRVLVTPSLNEMLDEPALKRDTWQSIRFMTEL